MKGFRPTQWEERIWKQLTKPVWILTFMEERLFFSLSLTCAPSLPHAGGQVMSKHSDPRARLWRDAGKNLSGWALVYTHQG